MRYRRPLRLRPPRAAAPLLAATLLAFVRPAAGGGFDHRPLDRVLKQHVSGGRVDYAAIKRRELSRLDAYLQAVGGADASKLARSEQLAFFLNAYNALVLRAVAAAWPVESVMKVPGFFKRVQHRVAGRRLTLDQLENAIIRPRFGDPRIHFGLVCAARGCPPLPSRAFEGETVDRDLEQLTKRFLNSPRGVRIVGGEVRVSRLFEWFAGDFKKKSGSPAAFIARYRPADARLLTRPGLALRYLEYDWAVNGK